MPSYPPPPAFHAQAEEAFTLAMQNARARDITMESMASIMYEEGRIAGQREGHAVGYADGAKVSRERLAEEFSRGERSVPPCSREHVAPTTPAYEQVWCEACEEYE